MKYSMLVLISLFLCSCVTFKQYDNKAKEAKDSNYEAYILKDDGTIISGKSLKHRDYDTYDHNLVRLTNKDNAFTLDGTKYTDKNVLVFQDKKAYHKYFSGMFLIRLVKGNINLYYFDQTGYNMGRNVRKSFFYFEKAVDRITPIGIKELREAVKDNAAALAKLNGYYPKDHYAKELSIEKLVSVIKIYNQ